MTTSSRTRWRTALVPILLLAAVASASAGVYRWRDSKGVVHYGGRPPGQNADANDVSRVRFFAEPTAMVRLRTVADGDGYLVYADNHLAGPIEVRIDFGKSDNMQGAPALPARASVAANDSTLMTRVSSVDPHRSGSFQMRFVGAVPGSSNARPRDVEYRYPLQAGQVQVEQGFGGAFSHTDEQNFHAVDFAAPIGTPVLAARAGVVMQVERDFDGAGLSLEKFGGRANFVRILHDDGSMALYAHLAEDGVAVKQGQRVQAGQRIGLSGNTGFSSGPHLHFVVQVNRSMQLQSIPFRMFGPGGVLRFTAPRAAGTAGAPAPDSL